ncbi:MAG: S8 family serine peptidase [Alphaproteobacteria bacterium]|nr:S8 family serine peptidase [Alphaproteobacteria bacterium]
MVHPVGRGGVALLRGPDALARAHADPQVRTVREAGQTHGTLDLLGVPLLSVPPGATPHRWYMDHLGLADPADAVGGTVALLDSGVAYPSLLAPLRAIPDPLVGVSIHHPVDVVDGDAYAGDEHQHGSHLAATMVGRGAGDEGVATGARLTPIRILDANNAGDEWTLVEGLYEAIDADADVVNLSVSFATGYAPSDALLDALDAVSDAGIVMVAAAGNDGAADPTWPAASPLVIAVAATALDASGGLTLAPYANRGPTLDVLAPGGRLDADVDGDGLVDGIVAETIDLKNPYAEGLWMGAGSSQAAALVSGAVLRLLDAGVPARHVRAALQAGSTGNRVRFSIGPRALSVGDVDIARALSAYQAGARDFALRGAILPFLQPDASGTRVRPAALVSLTDRAGRRPMGHAEAWIRVHGTTSTLLHCAPDGRRSVCVATGGTWVDIDDEAGWEMSFDAVTVGGMAVTFRPTRTQWVTEAWEMMMTALADQGQTTDRGLAIAWTADVDPLLGDVAPGYTLLDLSAGHALAPSGVVMTPPAFDHHTDAAPLLIDNDGTGFSTSPMGYTSGELRTTRRSYDTVDSGQRYNGGQDTTYVTMKGTAYGSEPVGWRATDLVAPRDGTDIADLLDVPNSAVDLVDLHVRGGDLVGTASLQQLGDGGWRPGGDRDGAVDWLVSELSVLLGW